MHLKAHQHGYPPFPVHHRQVGQSRHCHRASCRRVPGEDLRQHQKSRARVGRAKATAGSDVAASPWMHTEYRAAGAGRCPAKPHCARQAASGKVQVNARMAPSPSTQYGWGRGGLFIKCKGHDSCHQPPQPTDNTLGKYLLEN